jgi:branched-chain amino acid transport system permease protein
MGVSQPSDYPDRSEAWLAEFARRRREEIRHLLTDEVVAEHAANPLGYRRFHTAGLQHVLNYFRSQPVLGKYFVYASVPWREYRIAAVSERGERALILDEPVFATEEEAMHGVFLRRVDELRTSGD